MIEVKAAWCLSEEVRRVRQEVGRGWGWLPNLLSLVPIGYTR
jgi:hypothetical protein